MSIELEILEVNTCGSIPLLSTRNLKYRKVPFKDLDEYFNQLEREKRQIKEYNLFLENDAFNLAKIAISLYFCEKLK